jgi:uncharacterized membrane protein
MAFCPNCGNQVDGRFCAKCGTAVDAAAAGSAAPPAGAPATTQAAGLTDNVASALCYALGFITGILFLVLEPYSRNRKIRFHAFQSIFLNVACIVIWYVWIFISMASGALLLFMSPLVSLALFILWLFMMFKAYQDQKVVLPIIGPLAEKQANT